MTGWPVQEAHYRSKKWKELVNNTGDWLLQSIHRIYDSTRLI